MKIQKDTQRNLQKNVGTVAPNMATQRMNYASVSQDVLEMWKAFTFCRQMSQQEKVCKDSANLC